jgi:hypothetical protein
MFSDKKRIRLFSPCATAGAKCKIDLEKVGLGRSWMTTDINRNGTFVPFDGKKDGIRMEGETLVYQEKPWVRGWMTGEGEIRWANGMTTVLDDDLCQKIVKKETKIKLDSCGETPTERRRSFETLKLLYQLFDLSYEQNNT